MYYRPQEMADETAERVRRIALGTQLILGRETEEFESAIDDYLLKDSSRKSLFCSNGTVAIELALRALLYHRQSPSLPVVFMPVMTVPMVKWAIERAGCKPYPIDVDRESHCMDVEKATAEMERFREIGVNVFAVLFVYTGGLMPRNIQLLRDYCFDHNVQFVEDVSHAYKTMRAHDQWVPGTKGHAVCGSLFATKVLSLGEGGFVRFLNDQVYETAWMIRHQGKNKADVQTLDDCYNFRASEYAAAVGNVKLKYLQGEIMHRAGIVCDVYRPWVEERGLSLADHKMYISTSHYKAILNVPNAIKIENDFREKGIRLPSAVHRDILFDGVWPGAEYVRDNHICLPLSSRAAAEEVIAAWSWLYDPRPASCE